jgi:acyl carrier protein
VPDGAPGVLHVGGPGVAPGYLNLPGRSAEAFVASPFDPCGCARLYRTGDVCYRRPDGALVHVGRVDEQLNVRGARVEPREIELALTRHPGVADAVVLSRGGAAAIVAYWVARGRRTPEGELRRHLRGLLPEFMIPSRFCHVEAFPLTPNGKVDRRALASIDPEEPPDGADSDAAQPRTPLEEDLQAIWGEVLGRPRPGVHSNFFELGGSSLAALQLLSRIHRAYGVSLPVAAVLERPTVADLAARVEWALSSDAARPGRETGRL